MKALGNLVSLRYLILDKNLDLERCFLYVEFVIHITNKKPSNRLHFISRRY